MKIGLQTETIWHQNRREERTRVSKEVHERTHTSNFSEHIGIRTTQREYVSLCISQTGCYFKSLKLMRRGTSRSSNNPWISLYSSHTKWLVSLSLHSSSGRNLTSRGVWHSWMVLTEKIFSFHLVSLSVPFTEHMLRDRHCTMYWGYSTGWNKCYPCPHEVYSLVGR